MTDQNNPIQQTEQVVTQTLWGRVKDWLYGAIGAVFAILLGVIYALMQKNKNLERDNQNLQEQNAVTEAKKDYEVQSQKANDAESDYESLKREYDSSSDPDSKPKA